MKVNTISLNSVRLNTIALNHIGEIRQKTDTDIEPDRQRIFES